MRKALLTTSIVATGLFYFQQNRGLILPKADVVIWATAVALIMIMLGIIGYLINKGFDSLKASIEKEFKIIWEKIDAHQKQAEANTATLQAYQAADSERQKACDERHKRIDAEMERLRGGSHA